MFLVRDTHSDPAQLRALKILLPSLSSNEDFLKMFFTEAKIAAQLQHPNAVGITGFGQVDGIYCLGMEYVFGASLAQVLRASARAKKPLTVGVLLRITSQVCDALHYAHELKDERGQTMGLVHRDVTPQNILIGFNGVPKLTDFGIAKATNRGWETQAGIVKGKFSYMSPEQALGKKVDRRSDIFGAGIVLWEALTGRDLFKGSTPMEVLTNIREQKIEPPSKVVPGLTPIVDPIVMKALKRAPRQRYQTAAEMRDEIEDLIRRAGVNIDAQTISRELATIYGDDIVERAFALRSAMAGRADLEHLAKVLGGSKLEPKHLPEKRGGRNDPDPLGLFGPGSNGSWDIPRSESIDLPNPARMERSFSEAPPSSGEFEIVDSPEPEADEEFTPFDDDHHRAIESMVPNERIVTGWEDSTAAAGAKRDELLSMLSEEDATIGILPPEFAERFGQELRRALDDEDDAHFDDELTVGMPSSPELAELRALNFDDPSGMWGAVPDFGKVPDARTEALPASYGLRPVPRARQASSQESLRPVPRAPSLDMERPVPRAPSLDMDERTPYPEFEPGPFDPTDEPPLPSRPPLRP
ncbi:MAG: serine/threonine protein kinase, partial [Myxococcales bacterium]|nr:serine/threonine protein kinase [Myxococcales bacterium]